MKKIILITTILLTLLISCSKEQLITNNPTIPTIRKDYYKLFQKNVQWEFVSNKWTKSNDTNNVWQTGVGNIVLGSRVIFFEDFKVNTRRNGNNTGPNACNDYDCLLNIGGNNSTSIKDSSYVAIYNRYWNSQGSCGMFQNRFKIINFTDTTMTVFYFYSGNDSLPEKLEMYNLKIYR